MSDSRTTTEQFQLRTGPYLLPQGGDEIFVRTGSRAAFSKIIRDEQRRLLLTLIVRLGTQPTDVETLANQLQADVEPSRLSSRVPRRLSLGMLRLLSWLWEVVS